MVIGIICSAIAGAFISVQAAINAKMNVHLGAWATTVLVFIVGLVGSLVPLLLFGGDLEGIRDVSPIYALGGLRRDERDFGHCEDPVQHNQKQDDH